MEWVDHAEAHPVNSHGHVRYVQIEILSILLWLCHAFRVSDDQLADRSNPWIVCLLYVSMARGQDCSSCSGCEYTRHAIIGATIVLSMPCIHSVVAFSDPCFKLMDIDEEGEPHE